MNAHEISFLFAAENGLSEWIESGCVSCLSPAKMYQSSCHLWQLLRLVRFWKIRTYIKEENDWKYLISSNFKVIVSIFTTYFTEVCNMIHTHNLFWLKCQDPDFCDRPIYCIPFWHHKNNYAVIFLRHPFPVN